MKPFFWTFFGKLFLAVLLMSSSGFALAAEGNPSDYTQFFAESQVVHPDGSVTYSDPYATNSNGDKIYLGTRGSDKNGICRALGRSTLQGLSVLDQSETTLCVNASGTGEAFIQGGYSNFRYKTVTCL